MCSSCRGPSAVLDALNASLTSHSKLQCQWLLFTPKDSHVSAMRNHTTAQEGLQRKSATDLFGKEMNISKKKKNNQNVRLSACPALHHLGRNNRMQCKATWPLSAGRQQRFAAVIKGTTPVVPLTSCEMFFELHSAVLRLEVVLLYKSNAYVNYIGWSSQYWKNWGRGMLSHSRKVDVSKHRVETRVRPK